VSRNNGRRGWVPLANPLARNFDSGAFSRMIAPWHAAHRRRQRAPGTAAGARPASCMAGRAPGTCGGRQPVFNLKWSFWFKGGIMVHTLRTFRLVVLATVLAAGVAVEGASPPKPAPSQADRRAGAATAVKKVTVIADATMDAPARHGIRKLEEALRAKGVAVSEGGGQLDGSDFVVLAGLGASGGPAAIALGEMKAPVPGGAEALTIRKGARYQGKPAILLAGADGTGLMYAALDVADRVAWTPGGGNPFQFARDATEKPSLKERGVTIFTMNQAYFESHLHDEQFWGRYFDMFAADRINQLVLTFGYEEGGYMAPPYPYFFDVDGFPDVRVVGLTQDQQTRNRTAFQKMLRLAAERGIRVKPGIWDHIYRGGLQGGVIPWASDGTKPTPGLVWGLDAKNLAPYTVAALKKFYEVFPEINETQFRMHNESGLRNSEIEGFWHEVFGFFSKDKQGMSLELRAKGLSKSVIKDAQAQGLNVHLDTKIWMEQMGLPYHPTHVNKLNQMDARHSYADLLEYPQTYRVNWTLWNGGTTRILLWSDPDYARRLAVSARLYDGQGLMVTEMEATKLMAEPPDLKPRDFLNSKYRYFDYEFERYWAFYRVWGRLMYNPQTTSDVWEEEFLRRFGVEAGPHLMKALQLASRVLPRVVAASVPYRAFPTSDSWPEMQRQGSLPQFAQLEEGSDIQQFMNLRDEATSILQGTDTAMRRPEETSRWFAGTSDAILAEVAAAERALGGRTSSNEFKSTAADARILAAMARYHSWRQLGGVDYNLYKQAGDLGAFDEAIANERKAIQAWRELVEAAGDFYSDNMAFGPATRRFPRHWKDELKALETEFDQLLAERRTATARADARPVRIPARDPNPKLPVVTFAPASAEAVPGQDFVVKAKVAAPAGVKWIRLRYRHVNQKEDYQTADMTLDSRTGFYAGGIPASFVDPQWDLMYFIEIVDPRGNGRIYPDLEVETPYIVLGVKR